LQGSDAFLPKIKTKALIADKAYDAGIRLVDPLIEAGIKVVIPSKNHRRVKRDLDKKLYKARHLIENFFAKLKQYRAVATRYDKLARNFLGGIYLAASIIWLI
jgi:transposase